ncbi:MAG: thermonuclease family protein [Candidatus Dadabacteria bacterium]|nr:thermonuclease family protein [Candidatus Dadabacteria bacterium]
MPLIKNLLLLVIPLFLFSCYCHSEQANTCTVTKIVDGDTIYCSKGYGKEQKVRLIGIDTPESNKNPKTYRDAERTGQSVKSIIELGKKSTAFVKSRLSVSTEVRLELDVQQHENDSDANGHDKYQPRTGFEFRFVLSAKRIEITLR